MISMKNMEESLSDQEINEAVARKLGWTYDPKFQDWANAKDEVKPIPDFCHSIAAAWEVVEKLPSGFCLIRHEDGKFLCMISANRPESGGPQDTAPMAICMAFLRLEDPK